MQYKVLRMLDKWLPIQGILMWKSNTKREPCIPSENPFPTKPQGMAELKDVVVGLQVFIDYWQSLCDHDWSIYGFTHAYCVILDNGEGASRHYKKAASKMTRFNVVINAV